jgi:hypothetical protein
MQTPSTSDFPSDDELITDPETIEDEDTSRDTTAIKPWDPNKIRITTKNFSLREVVEQIHDHEIDLAPDFQRDYVWKERQKTRLIESILLGIPLPAFYFNQDSSGKYQIVDGVQRLSTIALFMDDRHVLTRADLEYLQDLDGIVYTKLDTAPFRRFRSTQIVVHIIEPQTPDELKYDIFNRVNTLGSPLSAQEIRHAMSKGKSRGFLKFLSELPEFDEATYEHFWRRDPDGSWHRNSERMTNRELALRFCAFRHFSIETYRSYQSLDSFLVEFTRRLDGVSETHASIANEDLEILSSDFRRAMKSAHLILGKAAFRRWPLSQKRRGPINRAVFESQAIALASHSTDVLLPHKEEILMAFRAAFDESEYSRAVTVGTGDPRRVEVRLRRTSELIKEILS